MLFISVTVSAEKNQRFSCLAGGEMWIDPESGGHGIALLSYDLEGLFHGARFSTELNTDTLRIGFDQMRFSGGRVEIGALTMYEAKFTGVLPDYYRLGKLDEKRGFEADQVGAQAFIKLNFPGNHYPALSVGVRRWSFTNADDTDPNFILPQEITVFEPRLHYTFWRIKSDPSLTDRHRLFPRVKGFAFGVEYGLDFRSEVEPWGAMDPQAFDPVDPRNDPDEVIQIFRQWMRAGWQLRSRLRTQIFQIGSFGNSEDDLTRVRIGGLNPYVVSVAGAPWAAFLSEKFIATQWSLHFRILRDMEIGLLIDGALIEDIERKGEDSFDSIVGIGIFSDLRINNFQIDIRGGWSPSIDWQSKDGQFSLYFAFGYLYD